MKKNRYFLFFILTLCIISLHTKTGTAQTVLLNYDRESEPKYEKGPNQKKFTQGAFHFGFVLPDEKKEISAGNSFSWGMGIRKKFKVSPVYSLGWEFGFDFTNYKYRNNDHLLSVYQTPVDARHFDVGTIALGFFNRFNVDPGRGNFLGTYIDLGINAGYCYSMQEVYKYETIYGRAKTEVSDLNYVKEFRSDVSARIGYSHIAFWATYRLTDYFKSDAIYNELPRIAVGIEFGMY